ncbi:MAG: carboxypeptidase regulatory-like domain-containing protein [Chloroflexi bacterium]|nr:carboxypeptidase regulatory-like domain-containing protein [Chloroflexota bacterium]
MKNAPIAGGALLALLVLGAALTWTQGGRYANQLAGLVSEERTRLPVPGAVVRVASATDAPREIKTADDGRYRIGVNSGALTVSVQARGYQTTTGIFAATDPALNEFALDVVLRPYAVAGVVRDSATQKPVAAALLSADDATAQSADDGRFRLERIEPGAKIKAEATGYYPQEIVWPGSAVLDFTLTARMIVVAVSSADQNKPLPATIMVGGVKYTADAQGRVSLREPAPGARIAATFEDYAGAETAYSGQAVVELALKPAAFRGVVKSARSGKPIAGAMVFVDGVAAISTNDDGKFGLAEVKPGARLKIKAAGYAINDMAVPPAPTAEIAMTPFAARGVYVPFGLLANESKIRGIFDLVDRTELNAIVVDVKSDRGKLAFNPEGAQLKALASPDVHMDVRELLRQAHARNIYVIARLVTFKDDPLAQKRPDLAVKTRGGKIWKDGESLAWVNPYLREVWTYNINIAAEIAKLGFDEVQFDYIRFPSDGNVSDIAFSQPNTPETRAATLRAFLNEVNRALKPYPIFISADIFGMTVWTKEDMGIGQHIEDIAPRVDYIQPMIYPSTFSADNLGYANPPAHPYEVIYRSVKNAMDRVSTPVRPWLQAYPGRNPTYSLREYLLQKQAANEAGAAGWTFWNAGGVYDAALFGP